MNSKGNIFKFTFGFTIFGGPSSAIVALYQSSIFMRVGIAGVVPFEADEGFDDF